MTQTMLYADNGDGLHVGARVELHPATDRWMRGDRFGTVTQIGRKRIRLHLDVSGKIVFVSAANIFRMINTN